MCKSRLILMLTVCVSAIAIGHGAVHADVSQSAAALLERAVEYDRSLSTPAEMSLEQRRLLAVTLASTELQSTNMSDFLYAFKEASALVTYLPQSDTTYIWQSDAWVPYSRSTNTYVSGSVSQIVGETYDMIEESWANESRQTFTYSDGQTATILFEYWQVDPAPAHWENSLLITYTYTGTLPTEVISQTWDSDSETWLDYTRSVSYFTSFKLDSTKGYLNVSQPTNWVQQSLTEYTYIGDLIQTITSNKTNVTTFLYDGSNREIRMLNQTLPGPVNVSKDTSVYDGSTSNQILGVHWFWNGMSWTLQSSDTTHYAANRPVRDVHYNYLSMSLSHDLYTYDANGNLIQDIEQDWDGAQWVNDWRDVYVYIVAGIFDDDASVGAPAEFAIGQNYPNPFNLNTVIPYSLAGDSRVKITVCNILGQTISTLVDESQPAGAHTAVWDGRDANGREAASGIYFTRVQVGVHSQVRKMVLLK